MSHVYNNTFSVPTMENVIAEYNSSAMHLPVLTLNNVNSSTSVEQPSKANILKYLIDGLKLERELYVFQFMRCISLTDGTKASTRTFG